MSDTLSAALQAVVRVGGGRGFVIETDRGRFIATAAHCLPELSDPHPQGCSTLKFMERIARRAPMPPKAMRCLASVTL